MRTERCREWRESLGAYVLGHLSPGERAGIEAHLEGCAACRAEAESLAGVSRLLPHADPERFGPAPQPPRELGDRIAATIASERRATRRRRLIPVSAIAAALAATVIAIFAIPWGGDGAAPARHVTFRSLPPGMKIGATLEPHAFGTEIHVYVKGASSGTLCRVFLRGRDGSRMPAGSFRYRWGDDSQAILSSAMELSHAAALGIRVGDHTFVAPM